MPEGSLPGLEVDTCFLRRLTTLARGRGLSVDPRAVGTRHGFTGDPVSLATVLAVAAEIGLPARHHRLDWRGLGALRDALPALMIFRDQSTAILDGFEGEAAEAGPAAVLVREDGDDDEPGEITRLSLDRDDLGPLWCGDLLVFET